MENGERKKSKKKTTSSPADFAEKENTKRDRIVGGRNVTNPPALPSFIQPYAERWETVLDIFFQTPSFFRFLKKCVVVRDKLPLIRRGTTTLGIFLFFLKGQKNMGVLSSIPPLFPTFFFFSFKQTPF